MNKVLLEKNKMNIETRNRPFTHSQFDSKIIHSFSLYLFYTVSYLPYVDQNGRRSSKSNGKDNELGCNSLIMCRYWNLVKFQRIILEQIENSQVVKTLKF